MLRNNCRTLKKFEIKTTVDAQRICLQFELILLILKRLKIMFWIQNSTLYFNKQFASQHQWLKLTFLLQLQYQGIFQQDSMVTKREQVSQRSTLIESLSEIPTLRMTVNNTSKRNMYLTSLVKEEIN